MAECLGRDPQFGDLGELAASQCVCGSSS